MFLDYATTLNLLEHDPEQHVLKEFSLDVQTVLVTRVVGFLSIPGTSKRTLTSPSHVKWAIETCGQGFCLSMDSSDSIHQLISLFRCWILQPAQRPVAINHNFQYFTQRILGCYSLLFEPRGSTIEEIQKQSMLCSDVLDIFISVARTLHDKLSQETWEWFLKLLISVTDLILRIEPSSRYEPFQEALCSQLVRVLMESWLLSETRNPHMWDALKASARHWTRHAALVTSWRMCVSSLLKRTNAVLYHVEDPADTVILSHDDSLPVQKLELSSEFVFYSWNRMLHLLDNPNESITVPSNFVEFMNGIESMVSFFMDIQLTPTPRVSRRREKEKRRHFLTLLPQGNTLFHIFGSWLFDAVHLNRSGFEEGTAVAIRTLVALVSREWETPLLPVYRAGTISALRQALAQDGRLLVTAMNSTSHLFRQDIEGMRVLLPSYLFAMLQIHSERATLDAHVIPPEVVRGDSLHILATIISLPFLMQQTPLHLQALTSHDPHPQQSVEIHTYHDLKPLINTILLDALEHETSAANLEMTFGLTLTWQLQMGKEKTAFINKSIRLLLAKITRKKWLLTVAESALRHLTEMVIHVPLLGTKAVPLAQDIVKELCLFLIQLGNPCQLPYEALAVLSLRCIGAWVLIPQQWILEDEQIREILIAALTVGLTGQTSCPLWQEAQSYIHPSVSPPSLAVDDLQATTGTNNTATLARIRHKVKEKRSERFSAASFSSATAPHIQRSRSALADLPGVPGSLSPDLDQFNQAIHEEARDTLNLILNQLGHFPAHAGAESVSSLVMEDAIFREMRSRFTHIHRRDIAKHARYFVTSSRTIICTIDRPALLKEFAGHVSEEGDSPEVLDLDAPSSPTFTVVIRDRNGTFTWDQELSYLARFPERNKLEEEGPPDEFEPNLEVSESFSARRQLSVQDVSQPLMYLQAGVHGPPDLAFEMVDAFVKEERALLEAHQYRQDVDIQIQRPPPVSIAAQSERCHFAQARLFLSQSGLLSVDHMDQFFPLRMNADFFALLEQLDAARERVCVRVAVLYANRTVSSKDTLAETFVQRGGTQDYQEFIATLGWGVDTYHHRGFGNLQETNSDSSLTQGMFAPYWADVATEFAFHVGTLMSEGDSADQRLEGALQCCCVVVWVENLDVFQPTRLIKAAGRELLIVTVTPIKGMLYVIHLYPSSRNVTCFSPLVDGMIVTKELIAPLIRATAKQAYELFVAPRCATPRNRRAALIEEIYTNSRYFPTVEEFYTNLFTDPSSDGTMRSSGRSGPRFKQETDGSTSPRERKLSHPLSARDTGSSKPRSRRLSVELDRKPISPRSMKEEKEKKRSRHRKKERKGEKRRLKRGDTNEGLNELAKSSPSE